MFPAGQGRMKLKMESDVEARREQNGVNASVGYSRILLNLAFEDTRRKKNCQDNKRESFQKGRGKVGGEGRAVESLWATSLTTVTLMARLPGPQPSAFRGKQDFACENYGVWQKILEANAKKVWTYRIKPSNELQGVQDRTT